MGNSSLETNYMDVAKEKNALLLCWFKAFKGTSGAVAYNNVVKSHGDMDPFSSTHRARSYKPSGLRMTMRLHPHPNTCFVHLRMLEKAHSALEGLRPWQTVILHKRITTLWLVKAPHRYPRTFKMTTLTLKIWFDAGPLSPFENHSFSS